jgi:hypothetical protein
MIVVPLDDGSDRYLVLELAGCGALDSGLKATIELYRIRRRGGASWWGVFRDLEHADVFLETFLVTSWAEHFRQHERFTRGDSDVEAAQVRRHVEGEPLVEHFVGADARSRRPRT